MASTSLTKNQRGILQALVESYADIQRPVKRERIAEILECHPVTVSTRIQNLRALQLVKSTSGPRGGYEPTLKGYDMLTNRENAPLADVPITSGGDSMTDIRIRKITLPEIHDPDHCRGELSLEGPLAEFTLGDRVSIGPIPVSNLRIDGIIREKDSTAGVLTLEIEAMHTLPDDQTILAE